MTRARVHGKLFGFINVEWADVSPLLAPFLLLWVLATSLLAGGFVLWAGTSLLASEVPVLHVPALSFPQAVLTYGVLFFFVGLFRPSTSKS